MPFATKLEAEEQAVRSNCRGSRVKAVLLRPQMEHRMKLKSNFVPDTEFEGK